MTWRTWPRRFIREICLGEIDCGYSHLSDLNADNNDHSVPTKVLATTRYMNEKMTQPLYLCKMGRFCLLTMLRRNRNENSG